MNENGERGKFSNRKIEKMSIYCWGSTINGELGLGGIEDEQVCIH